MSFANILVSVDLDEAAAGRIRLATDLTRRFEATLTGIAACKVPAPVLVQDIYDAENQEAENKARAQLVLNQASALFRENAGSEIRTDWLEAFAGPIKHLVEQARAADLIVVGRRGSDDEQPGELGVKPGPILMEAGRPVLVVPPRVEHLKASRIIVAWKDSVEARRAVSAALPFIRAADHVFVVSAGEGARFEGAEEVASHLARHGASVSTHLLRTVASDGDELLRFAGKQDADLIVMGAYGHSRLREWMFGGVTHDVLERSLICSLMCH